MGFSPWLHEKLHFFMVTQRGHRNDLQEGGCAMAVLNHRGIADESKTNPTYLARVSLIGWRCQFKKLNRARYKMKPSDFDGFWGNPINQFLSSVDHLPILLYAYLLFNRSLFVDDFPSSWPWKMIFFIEYPFPHWWEFHTHLLVHSHQLISLYYWMMGKWAR